MSDVAGAEKKEIEREMCDLEFLAEELGNQFDGLAERMAAVTRPTQPSEPGKTEKTSPETGLDHRLRSIFDNLEALLGHIQSIKSRLEL